MDSDGISKFIAARWGGRISVFHKASRKLVEKIMKVRLGDDGKPHPSHQNKSGRSPDRWVSEPRLSHMEDRKTMKQRAVKATNMAQMGWKDCSVVSNTYSYRRGPKFRTQHPCWVAHYCL